MKKKVLLYGILLILFVAGLVFLLMFSYQLSPKLITINSMKLEKNNLKLTLTNNNDSGYLRKIKIINKDNKVYIYFIGTVFKEFKMDDKSVHNITVDVEKIDKVLIKGRSIETVVFQVTNTI